MHRRLIFATLALAAACVAVLPASAAQAKRTPWKKVGHGIELDLPHGFGWFRDADRHRPGTQVVAQAYWNSADGRVRFAAFDGRVIGESDDGGFEPVGSLGAGWRGFVWGEDGAGGVRMWTPAFDADHTLLSTDPSTACGDAVDGTTPLAGPFQVTIPAGASPGGHRFESPASVLVYGPPGVRIATADGLLLGQRRGRSVATGGFAFAGAVFAYGTDGGGHPRLWTPALRGRSTRLVPGRFVPCTATGGEIDFDRLQVVSTPDAQHEVTATIGALGGTVAADGADGAHYELFVPPGALSTDTAISIAPTTVDGLEAVSTSTPYAVDFAPAGLSFAIPATLTITPPAGGPPPGDFAAGWSVGAGVEIRPLEVGPDGSLHVGVPHFSGVTTLQSTLQSYDQMLTLALSRLPDFQGLRNQLRTDAAGLPGSAQAVVADVMAIYDGYIAPALAAAKDGVVELEVASRQVEAFSTLFQLLPIGDVAMATTPPKTLQDFDDDVVDAYKADALDLVGHYLRPRCDATVDGLAAWLAVPITVAADLARWGEVVAENYCVGVDVQTLDFPSTVDRTQQLVDGSLRGVVVAPAQTPGGLPGPDSDHVVFPQPTEFELSATGAVFSGGGTSLDRLTGEDGTLQFELDRGPDEATRPLRVDVGGTATVAGFWADVERIVSLNGTLPVGLTVGPPNAVRVSFRSPPVNAILDPGGTSSLCVDVADAESNVVPQLPVDWSLDGPGSLAAPTTPTNDLGIACVDYHHPAGPVAQGDTATVTAHATYGGAEGSDAVTLTPDWASIAIEVKSESAAGFTTATNTTANVPAGEQVQVLVALTGPGATPADPPQPLPATSVVQIGIDSGGGTLVSPDGSSGPVALPLLDANGQAEITWDPGTSTAETTLAVTYPPAGLGFEGVAATVTFEITHPTVTRTDSYGKLQAFSSTSSCNGQSPPGVGTWSETLPCDSPCGGTESASGSFDESIVDGTLVSSHPTGTVTWSGNVGTCETGGDMSYVLFFHVGTGGTQLTITGSAGRDGAFGHGGVTLQTVASACPSTFFSQDGGPVDKTLTLCEGDYWVETFVDSGLSVAATEGLDFTLSFTDVPAP